MTPTLDRAAPGRDETLTRECRLFTEYLLDRPPDPTVVTSYLRCHQRRQQEFRPSDTFDRFLLRLARTGGPGVLLADSYAAVMRSSSLVRKKLVLLAALAESRPETAAEFEVPDGSQPALVWLRGLGMLAASGLALATSLALLGPVHVMLRLARARRRNNEHPGVGDGRTSEGGFT